MIQYGDKFKLMDVDGTFVGVYKFVKSINNSDSFYYRGDDDEKILVSEKGQWISKYLPTITQKQEENKTEDIMVTIENTINTAFEQLGEKFEKLLEEKINEIKEISGHK